jgi:uncharacterized coiled-coil protein SlyX
VIVHAAHGSLKSPGCSCVSITLPASFDGGEAVALAAFYLDKLEGFFPHSGVRGNPKSLLGSAEKTSIQWGSLPVSENDNYKTNPTGKKERIQSMKPLIKLKTTTLLVVPLVLAGFALLPRAQAQAPEGVTPFEALPGFNTRDGFAALNNLTTGIFNSAFGALTLVQTSTGSHNTALGAQALRNNNGDFNTAVGENALVFNTSGSFNMALGQGALANNQTGDSNTAMGFQALNANTVSENTAVGFQAARNNTTGIRNTAVGFQALFINNTGSGNTANGISALPSNTTGNGNTAIGEFVLFKNTQGNNNTAIGDSALFNTTTGDLNVGLGPDAGSNVSTANDVICIGANVAGENVSNTCFIGNIFGVTSASSTAVFVNELGKLGTVMSSRRFKDEIQPMDKASEAILALKPVTFRYKQDVDPARSPQFGLVAEDVEKVNPDLVVRDAEGKVNTVRYEAVNAMLLNEFLKEHRTVQELKSTVAKQEATAAAQQKEIKALTARLEKQAAQLQKVSAQLEVSKPVPRTVLNNP